MTIGEDLTAGADRLVLTGGRVVTPDGVVDGGWLALADGHISAVGSCSTADPDDGGDEVDLDGRWVLPGFVDLHVHGGGGHSVLQGDPDAVAGAVAFHQAHGTTRTLLSLVTAPVDRMAAALGRIADAVDVGDLPTVAGVHLEGPFLARVCCGAQDPAAMVDPDLDVADALLAAGRGTVRVVTVAPERPGGLDLVRHLVERGPVVALGHSDADTEVAQAAVAAGARLATHLANAMRPLHHRDPGVFGVSLADPEVVCELIVDGVHLHPVMVRLAAGAKGPDGVVLVTDAIAAAGVGDGRHRLGSIEVDVDAGVVRAVGTGALAGSTLTMDAALRGAIGCGWSIEAASRAASLVPARVLGLDAETGSIESGKAADLVVLDAHLTVEAVLIEGRVAHDPSGRFRGRDG